MGKILYGLDRDCATIALQICEERYVFDKSVTGHLWYETGAVNLVETSKEDS